MSPGTFSAVAAVTLAALLQFVLFGALVMKARVRLGVTAPATQGPPEFDRLMRIHLNTMERLVVFLPMLWMAAAVVRSDVACAFGLLFIVSRFVYWRGYVRDPASRMRGNMLTMLSIAGLLVSVRWGLGRQALG